MLSNLITNQEIFFFKCAVFINGRKGRRETCFRSTTCQGYSLLIYVFHFCYLLIILFIMYMCMGLSDAECIWRSEDKLGVSSLSAL